MIRRLLPLVVLALSAAQLLAQPGRFPGGGPGGAPPLSRAIIELTLAISLYSDPVVQAELKLTEEQKAKLAKIPDDLLAKYKDQIEKEKMESQAAAEKSVSLRAELQKKIDEVLAKHLSASQVKRFEQLVVQAMGTQAFRGNPEIAKALSLPEDAAAQISKIQQANVQKLQKEFPDYNPQSVNAETRQKYAAAQQQMVQETVRQFVVTLSDEQKKLWKEMTGEPSEAAGITVRRGPGSRTPGFVFLFNPTTRGYWQNRLLGNEAAIKELKVEMPARIALVEGFRAISVEARTVLPPGVGGGSLYVIAQTEAHTAAEAVLTQEQSARLKQVQFQWRGLIAFDGYDTSELLAKLTLTPAQAAKIDSVLAEVAKKKRAIEVSFPLAFGLRSGFPENAEMAAKRVEYNSKLTAIDRAALADILATFDAGQMSEWKAVTGNVIDVTKITVKGMPYYRGGFNGLSTGSLAYGLAIASSNKQRLGHYAAALACLDEAIRLAPGNAIYQLSKVELLASCPSEYVRDGKQAVELARKLIAQLKETSYNHHNALAMAMAEAGQFDEAVKAQEKAIAMLPLPPKANPEAGSFTAFNITSQLKSQYEAQLKLFQQKKPYRQELQKLGGFSGPSNFGPIGR